MKQIVRIKTVIRLASLGLVVFIGACWPFPEPPAPTDLSDRLSAFPTEGLAFDAPVEIRWNDHQVPYIIAQNDADAAYALGLVHAHLRLGQMAIMRQVAQARVAEIIGAEGIDIDRGLLMLDLMSVAKESVELMDPETRAWAQRFVDGINAYQWNGSALPYEFEALGLKREAWQIEDVVALVHLTGIDVTWLRWSALLPLRAEENWDEIWAAAQEGRKSGPMSFPFDPNSLARPALRMPVGEGADGFLKLLKLVSKSGSNSYALSPDKSASGGALIASDPHLGLLLPNLYLLVGVHTPTTKVVGLMGPGQPIFSIGRNEHVAWGHSNLIGAASDLIDVSDLNPSEISTEISKVKVRFLPDRELSLRRTNYGPIISDLDVIDGDGADIALKWIGQNPSDEIGAGLSVSRAKDWPSFQRAFEGHALPSQNMIYADDRGNIGQLVAAHLPKRNIKSSYRFLRRPEAVMVEWQETLDSMVLPSVLNPSSDFVATSNNKPSESKDQLLGFFFGSPDRITRLQSILNVAEDVSVDDLKLLQRDAFMSSSLLFRDELLSAMDKADFDADSAALVLIREWDGHYDANSEAALAFEGLFGPLVGSLYSLQGRKAEFDALQDSGDLKWGAVQVLAETSPEVLRDVVPAALVHAEEALEKYETWGGMHRLRLAHPFALVPEVDQTFFKIDLPAGGSAETLMKTAHPPTTKNMGPCLVVSPATFPIYHPLMRTTLSCLAGRMAGLGLQPLLTNSSCGKPATTSACR